jgi:Ham1 family
MLHAGLNRMLDGFPTRAAWALCTFAYSAGPGAEPILFEGRTEGKIVPARGPSKFGWDPVFEVQDTGLTYVCYSLSTRSFHAGTSGLTERHLVQLRGDGSKPKEHNFPSRTGAAKASRVFTGTRDGKRRRILITMYYTSTGYVELLDVPPLFLH